MTSMQLRASVFEKLNALLDNEEAMRQLDCYLYHLNQEMEALAREQQERVPCQYTLEEVKQRLRSTEADAITGRGLSEEEVDKLIDAIL